MSKDDSLAKYQAFLGEQVQKVIRPEDLNYEEIKASFEMQLEESGRIVEVTNLKHDLASQTALYFQVVKRGRAVRVLSFEDDIVISENPAAVPVLEPLGPPPGTGLKNIFSLVCPPAFVKRELDALVADGEELYLEQIEAGNKRRAAVVKVSIHCWLIWSVFGGAISVVMSAVMGKMKSRD